MKRLLDRLATVVRGAAGYSVVELVAVMGILLVVLTGLTTLFVSGTRAELDLNNRFQAQQEARLAVDRMRREIHCASGLTVTSPSSVTVTLPAACPTAGGTQQNVVYDLQQVGTERYELRRAGQPIADYITGATAFSYVPPSSTTLGRLHVDLPVDVKPGDSVGDWRLATDIVLRNTVRA